VPSPGLAILSNPASGTIVSIFQPITLTVTGQAGAPVAIWTRKYGDSNLFGWRLAENFSGNPSTGVIGPTGVFTYTFTTYDQYGFVFDGAPYVPPGDKYYKASADAIDSQVGQTNVIRLSNRSRT